MSNNPGIFDGRRVVILAASNVLRRPDDPIYDEVFSVIEDASAPFIAVLYGEDLGASVSLMLDLRTNEVVYCAPNTSDHLRNLYTQMIQVAYAAEVLFEEEMTAAHPIEKEA